MKKLFLLLAFVLMTDVLSAYDAIVARGRQLGKLTVLHEYLRSSCSRRTVLLVICCLKVIDLGSSGKWLANLRGLAIRTTDTI